MPSSVYCIDLTMHFCENPARQKPCSYLLPLHVKLSSGQHLMQLLPFLHNCFSKVAYILILAISSAKYPSKAGSCKIGKPCFIYLFPSAGSLGILARDILKLLP